MIVDCHVHAGAGVGLHAPGDRASPFARALRRARAAGIDRCVLFSGFAPDYAVANRGIARIVQASPERFHGFACVHAVRDRGRVAALLEDALVRSGLVGVKVHRRDAPLTDEICDVAAAFGAPLLYDPMGEIDLVERLARRHPDVAFVVPHLGSFADDAEAQRRFVPVLVRAPNVFGDTSAVKLFDLLEQAVREAGPRKILFGSDAPWLHPGLELEKVRALGLAPDDERRVLGANLLRLLARVPFRASAHQPAAS